MASFRRVKLFSKAIEQHQSLKRGATSFRNKYVDMGGDASFFIKQVKKLKKINRKNFKKTGKRKGGFQPAAFYSKKKSKGFYERTKQSKMDFLITRAGRNQIYMDRLSHRMGGYRKKMGEMKYLQKLFREYSPKKDQWWKI